MFISIDTLVDRNNHIMRYENDKLEISIESSYDDTWIEPTGYFTYLEKRRTEKDTWVYYFILDVEPETDHFKIYGTDRELVKEFYLDNK